MKDNIRQYGSIPSNFEEQLIKTTLLRLERKVDNGICEVIEGILSAAEDGQWSYTFNNYPLEIARHEKFVKFFDELRKAGISIHKTGLSDYVFSWRKDIALEATKSGWSSKKLLSGGCHGQGEEQSKLTKEDKL